MARGTGLSCLALLALLACASADETPTGPGPYIAAYILELDSTVVGDSLVFLNPLGDRVPGNSPQHGFLVAFQMLSGDSMGATAWLHATGPGSATLRASWESNGRTHRRTAQVTADSAGPLVLTVPDFALP